MELTKEQLEDLVANMVADCYKFVNSMTNPNTPPVGVVVDAFNLASCAVQLVGMVGSGPLMCAAYELTIRMLCRQYRKTLEQATELQPGIGDWSHNLAETIIKDLPLSRPQYATRMLRELGVENPESRDVRIPICYYDGGKPEGGD